MSECYKCGIELVDKKFVSKEVLEEKRYKSEEQIIPNFCGGRLVSDYLLCSRCNTELRTKLEGALSKELLFAYLVPLKLDRGTQIESSILGYTKDGNVPVLIDKNLAWRHFKPHYKINEEGELIELIAQTEEQAL